MSVPRYRELPRVGSLQQRCAWGVFGEDDVLGRLNLITAQARIAALDDVVDGTAVSLSWDPRLPSPALQGRKNLEHTAFRVTDGWDDVIDRFCPQGSSQWDALVHCRHPELGYYNGFPSPDEADGGQSIRGRIGIHNFARQTITGRFVLADVERHGRLTGIAYPPDRATAISAETLDVVLDAQGTTVREGDVLLVRTGWIGWYEGLDDDGRRGCSPDPAATIGLERSEQLLEWLWDSGFSAVVADNPSLEVIPFDTRDAGQFLHYELIPLLGFALGEMFDLRALADLCERAGRWSGMLSAAPLNLHGGVGSPGNAVALL